MNTEPTAPPDWDQEGYAREFKNAHYNSEMGWFTPLGEIDSEFIYLALTKKPIRYIDAERLLSCYLTLPKDFARKDSAQ